MPHAPGEGPSLWDRACGRPRSVLTGLLGGVVAIGAGVPWLVLVDTWRGTSDPGMFADSAEAVPRALVMAEMLRYPYFPNSVAVLPALCMLSAVVLLVLLSRAVGADLSVGGPRAAVLLVGVVTLAATLAVAVRLGFLIYALTSTPEELIGVYFSPTTGIGGALGLLAPFAELLAWAAVLTFGLACWRMAEVDHVEEPDDGGDPTPGSEVAEALPPREGGSAPQPPREKVDPARLRPDGSSDSGFDEFHFRR